MRKLSSKRQPDAGLYFRAKGKAIGSKSMPRAHYWSSKDSIFSSLRLVLSYTFLQNRTLYIKLDFLSHLNVLISSDRKRMSVILKDTAGDIWLYCKGADSSVFPLVHDGDFEAAKAYVADFSRVRFYF